MASKHCACTKGVYCHHTLPQAACGKALLPQLPGDAVLEFAVESTGPDHSILHQTALFKPRGLFGLIYWYSVVPLHNYVFSGMLRGICNEARKIASEKQLPGAAFEVKQHA